MCARRQNRVVELLRGAPDDPQAASHTPAPAPLASCAHAVNELSSLEAFSAATKGLRPPIDLTRFPAEYHCLSHVNEQCWDSRSNKRPSAQEVVATLLALLRRVDATLNQQVSDDMPVEQHKRPPFGVDRSESMEDPRIGMRGVMTYTAGKTPPQARQVDASPLARSEPM